ncbi:MAG: hypothetical protein U9N41_00895 [Euryarchaeota archaeon]|nr:hypothetical protein [Euryarchaeota archaeon]
MANTASKHGILCFGGEGLGFGLRLDVGESEGKGDGVLSLPPLDDGVGLVDTTSTVSSFPPAVIKNSFVPVELG